MTQYYPTLKTVLMVEKFLIDRKGELFSKASIMRGLNGRINNASLSTVLDYLEASNKVLQGSKGIQWIGTDGKKARQMMKRALVF